MFARNRINADERLTPIGYRVGTIRQEDYDAFVAKQRRIAAMMRFLANTRLDPASRAGREVYTRLDMMAGDRFLGASTLTGEELLKRQNVKIDDLLEWIGEGLRQPGWDNGGAVGASDDDVLLREEARRIETEFKYEGYLQQQEKQIERMKRAESRRIPDWFDYGKVSGLSREVVEKFTRVRPLTLGQALRIPGITPAAVSLVDVYIEIFQRRAAEHASA